MTVEKNEYKPIMLHGWTHLPTYMLPEYIPVDHLPWVFRDVANYHHAQSDLQKPCVYILPVHDELFLTIEHLRIHRIRNGGGERLDFESPFHPLQMVDCIKGGKGPRYIAARDRSEFAIPSVVIRFQNGDTGSPECEDGPMRFELARRVGIPYVLSLVSENHFENGHAILEKNRSYIAPIDPQSVDIRFTADKGELESQMDAYSRGKRWDHILELAYLRDSTYCYAYTPDLSTIPTFFRETNYLEEREDESYEIESGYDRIAQAQSEGLDFILAVYRDTLRIDSETLRYHNRLFSLTRSRDILDHQDLGRRRNK